MDESQQWVAFGQWISERREEIGLRRRDAAKRAKMSEAQWRDLETGRKESVGPIRLLPNPSRDVLDRVAAALEVPVEDVLARIGRSSPRSRRSLGVREAVSVEEDGSLLGVKLRRLSNRDRQLVETLVDAMIEREED